MLSLFMTFPPVVMARWASGCEAHLAMLLLELEDGRMLGAVDEAHDQLAALPSPALLVLPGVAVLDGRRVVVEAAGAGRHGLLDVVELGAAAAGDRLRLGIARREDSQPKVPAQAEEHRHAAAGLDAVDRWQIVDRLEEAAPGVDHLVA